MDRTYINDKRGFATKAAKGIAIRHWKNSTTIRMSFAYKGVACRETLALPATKANLQYAERLRAEILNAIARNNFNYLEYFPDSKRARIFGYVNVNPLIGNLLQDFLHRAERSLERSTVAGYQRVTNNYLMKSFAPMPIRELTPAYLRKWIVKLNLTSKTVRNILIPLRAILDEAVNDDIIPQNPLDRVVLGKLLNKQKAKSTYVVDPFDLKEISALLAHTEDQIHNLLQFIFFTGLRSSEWMAVKWEDVDWIHGTLRISRAFVERHEKATKTAAGTRTLVLLPPALEALHAQKTYTFLQGQHIFHCPHTHQPWQTNSQFRFQWERILKKAGVRYRNPYQTRHTYASMLLSAGENMLWVAKQMGHRDTEMIIKTYGKWIPDTTSKTGYQPAPAWQQVLQSRRLPSSPYVLSQ